MLTLAWLLITPGLGQEPSPVACPDDPVGELRSVTVALERAYDFLDEPGFAAQTERLSILLDCVDVELSQSDALQVHRARALTQFVGGDTAASSRSFSAIRALSPNWTPSASMFPSGHPLEVLWRESAAEGASADLPAADAGDWSVDGMRTAEVPLYRSFLIQEIARTGEVRSTGYHVTVTTLPFSVAPEDVQALAAIKRRKSGRAWGTAASVAILAGAATSGALALSARQKLSDRDTDPNVVQDLVIQSNVTGGIGIGLGVAGVALFTTTWAVKW